MGLSYILAESVTLVVVSLLRKYLEIFEKISVLSNYFWTLLTNIIALLKRGNNL